MRYTIWLACILCPAILFGQRTDKKLQQKVEDLVKGFNGEIGIYIQDLNRNRVVALHADTLFPTASIVKVPLMIGIMDKMNQQALQYHQLLTYKDSLYYAGEDILGSFKDGEKIKLSKVIMLMLTASDNTASLWIQSLAGGGGRINQLLDSFGFKATRVNSRTPGRETNRAAYGWGQTTPREMGNLLGKIVNNKLFNRPADEKMLRLLSRQYWDEEAMSEIPPGVFVADKNGAVDASRSELMYVSGNGSSYIVSIFTKNNRDTSWTKNNEAWILTRKLSAMVWKHFNPGSNWSSGNL